MERHVFHVLGLLLLFSSPACSAETVITLKDHQFSPHELTIPAGQKIQLTIKNLDATPAEFESTDLNREKVVSPNSQITVFIGPLDPGRYGYFDDFHRDSTSIIIAK